MVHSAILIDLYTTYYYDNYYYWLQKLTMIEKSGTIAGATPARLGGKDRQRLIRRARHTRTRMDMDRGVDQDNYAMSTLSC